MSSNNPIMRCTLAALAALLMTACEGKPTPAQPVDQARVPAASSDACQPVSELNALDPRRPVPLQPMMAWHQKQNMQDHLVAIERIVDGLAREDWEAIGVASARIESSPQMQQMCEHMGAGADGFTEMALDFHRKADAIGEAADARDAQAVLRATSNTLQACTSCHSTYRQEVVDAETWTSRTGQAHDPSMMQGAH
jgi:hypothetical protein